MEISKNKIAHFSGLLSKKIRRKKGIFSAEGTKCVLDTLGAFELVNIIATHDWLNANPLPPYVDKTTVLTADSNVLKKISTLSTPSDVIAIFRLPATPADVDLLDSNKLYLLLDGIQDPGNLGTIIRTADWFGFRRIVCSPDTVDVFNPKTIQATMGSLRRVSVEYTDLVDLIKRSNVKIIYGTVLEGENIFSKALLPKGVIVMGNEGNGLSEEIRALVTDPLFIPPADMDSHPESLNVAVATAITISQFIK